MGKIKIQQYKSVIRKNQKQRRTVEALGLRKLGMIKEVDDMPNIRGMLRKVEHIVRIIE